MRFLDVMQKEMTESWRSRRLLVLVAVLTVFGMASPLLARFMPEMMRLLPGGEAIAEIIPTPSLADAVGQYAKNLTQFSLVLAILLTMGSVVGERERGTAAMMLVKPVARSSFLGAKLASLAVGFAVALLFAAAGGYLYLWILFGAPPAAGWLALNALLLLYALVYVAITLFASTIARSVAMAAGIAVGLAGLLGLVGIIPDARRYLPGMLATWGTQLAMGAQVDAWSSVAVSVALVAACFVAAWVVFEKSEI
jgi:ABC-2 type transport system permease protein